LIGKGDMLFEVGGETMRLQSGFVDLHEVNTVVESIVRNSKQQTPEPEEKIFDTTSKNSQDAFRGRTLPQKTMASGLVPDSQENKKKFDQMMQTSEKIESLNQDILSLFVDNESIESQILTFNSLHSKVIELGDNIEENDRESYEKLVLLLNETQEKLVKLQQEYLQTPNSPDTKQVENNESKTNKTQSEKPQQEAFEFVQLS
jgi:hypothetical protein